MLDMDDPDMKRLDIKLVFADYADGGHMFEVYYGTVTNTWWIVDPNMDYDTGLVRPETVAQVLSNYILSSINDSLPAIEATLDWIVWLKECVRLLGPLMNMKAEYSAGLTTLLKSVFWDTSPVPLPDTAR